MPDLQTRVTVVGPAARVDAAVPAGAPIAEYIDELARRCAADDDTTLPPAWTLGAATRRPLPPTTSLAAAGVLDGQVLYLRDLTAGEYDEPLELEVDELVAGAADRSGGPRWTAGNRVSALLVAGAAWLTAVWVALLVAAPGPDGAISAFALPAALLPSLFGWVAARGRMAIPAPARTALALCAVPCLGVAGYFIGYGHPSGPVAGVAGPSAYVGLTCGALAGCLVTLSAAPNAATFAVLILGVVAATVVANLAALGTPWVENACVTALAAYLILLIAPALSGHLAATWGRLSGRTDAETTVVTARRLLAGTHLVTAVAIAVPLAVLGTSQSRYAMGLALSLSLALLLRTVTSRFLIDAGLLLAAGMTGLIALTLSAPHRLGWPAWLPEAAGLGFGMAVIVIGLVLAFRGKPVAAPGVWTRTAAALCALATVPLAVGVFGLFDYLVRVGRRM